MVGSPNNEIIGSGLDNNESSILVMINVFVGFLGIV